MKKLLVPTLLFALAGILFSSCSNSSKLAFTKRHYRSGYFVNHVGKTNTTINPSVARMPVRTERSALTTVIAKSGTSVGKNKPAVISQKSAVDEKIVLNTKTQQHSTPTVNATSIGESAPLINAKNDTYSNNEEKSEAHVRVDANVSFVVVVLCAIFLPPLGVALVYGIDSYFWIDLILTLLFFFPGMIFALIVVLT